MKQKDIYKAKKELINKRIELEQQKKEVDKQIEEMQNQCPHDIALSLDDHRPHKVGKITTYFCPICGKQEKIYPTHELEDSSFKNSKTIDLTIYPMEYLTNDFQTIINYIINNLDYFYNEDAPLEELRDSIVKLIDPNKGTAKTLNASNNKQKK